MSTILLASSAICLVLNSWISIWVALELNTLAFCCLMKTFSMEKSLTTEMGMKYFVIQSISSSLLIFSMLMCSFVHGLAVLLIYLGVTSLMVKMASSPFHQWFINMAMKTKWKNSILLMTWQKLAPVFLVLYQVKAMVYPFMMISVIVGSASQINKSNVMEILALSSVFNLSWMLLAVVTSFKIFVLFSLIYWISVILMVLIVSKSKLNKISSESVDESKKWIYFLVAINLAGIPPMAGFMAKWIVFSENMKSGNVLLVTVLLILSSVNLYIYLRLMNLIFTKSILNKQKSFKKMKKSVMSGVMLLNMYPLAMLSVYSKRLEKGLFW